jgi:hypothetical protein
MVAHATCRRELVMGKGGRLGDRPMHGDGRRIARPGEGARAAAIPVAEAEAARGRRRYLATGPGVPPPATGAYLASRAGDHGQEILSVELGRVSGVSGRRNAVRDRAPIAPLSPRKADTGATTLRRTCSDSMSRTRYPAEGLGATVSGTVNPKAHSHQTCSHCYLNGPRCWGWGWSWRR